MKVIFLQVLDHMKGFKCEMSLLGWVNTHPALFSLAVSVHPDLTVCVCVCLCESENR